MIGKYVRGIRHLVRLSNPSPTPILLIENGVPYDLFEIIRDDFNGKNRTFIFGKTFNDCNIDRDSRILNTPAFKALSMKSRCIFEIKSINHAPWIDTSEIIMLPSSFDNDYKKFLAENQKMINELSNRYGFSTSSIDMKALYCYTNGSKNFFSWAVNLQFKCHVRLDTIKNIMLWYDLYGQMTKLLKRNTITAYTSKDSIYDLLSELTNLRMDKRLNESINSFNTLQKKLLKSYKFDESDKHALSLFAKLSNTKRLNFIKKMSSVEDISELLRQLKFITSTHFSWNKASLIDYLNNVENLNYEIKYDKENIMVLKVYDFETIKQLAKTTNWCISKNKSYWNNYVSPDNNASQYVLFDFSKEEDDRLSIIGFTVMHNKGITNAHDFTNNNLFKNCGSDYYDRRRRYLKSYIDNFLLKNNIYEILKIDGLDASYFETYDRMTYKWNKECFLKHLYSYIDSFNVNVLSNIDNKLALSIKDENICGLLGETYRDTIPSEYNKFEHIVFLDFSKNENDTRKLEYAIVFSDSYGENSVSTMYDEFSRQINDISFDEKLIEYKLPYDIIRRKNNSMERFVGSFLNFNIPNMKLLLSKDKTLLVKSKDHITYHQYVSVLSTSLIEYVSFDYLDIIYDNGYTINDICGSTPLRNILKILVSKLMSRLISINGRDLYDGNPLDFKTLSKEDIDKFFSRKLKTKDEAEYIGYYLMLKKIMLNEDFSKNLWTTFGDTFNLVRNYSIDGEIIVELFTKIFSHADFSKSSQDTVCNILMSLEDMRCNHGLKDILLRRKDDCEIISNGVIEYNKRHQFTYADKVSDDSFIWHSQF